MVQACATSLGLNFSAESLDAKKKNGDEILEAFNNYEIDVMISYKKISRGNDNSLIGVILNLLPWYNGTCTFLEIH